MSNEDSPPDARSRLVPTSHVQRSMWFEEHWSPSSVRNHLTIAVEVLSSMDARGLRRALQAVVDATPGLRTTFREVDGELVQRIETGLEVDLTVLDGTNWSRLELEERLVSEHLRSFDLEHGPLVRFLLVDLSDGGQVFVIAIHHLITDLWSNALLASMIATTYEQVVLEGDPPMLEEQPSYEAYVTAEHDVLSSASGLASLEFWRPMFDRWTSQDLSTDRPDGENVRGLGAVEHLAVPPRLFADLQQLATERSTTVKTIVLAAFQAALHRQHSLASVTVGEIKANRSVRLARLVGCCINPTVRTAAFSAETTLASLVDAATEDAVASRPHERYPFPALLHELRPGHGPFPFFAASFNWQKSARTVDPGLVARLGLGASGDVASVSGFEVRPFPLPIRSAPLPLSLVASAGGADLEMSLEYQPERFDAETVARLGRCIVTVLEAMVTTPDQRVDDVDLVPSSERDAWRREWDSVASPPTGSTVHSLVEQQVVRNPTAIAVVDAFQSLSYTELDERANRLARHLGARGVRRGALVGICMDRTAEMVVAMLAIWKCGAGYVPLDPDFPAERLRIMVADAGLSTVVSRSPVGARPTRDASDEHSIFEGCDVVDVERERAEIDEWAHESVAVDVDAADVAYVIFTSGSTGRPKGVAVEHRNVVNFLESMARVPGLRATDVMLAATTLSFDISVLEIALPLVVGASIKLVDRATVVDPGQLANALRDVTVAQGTPTMWKMLVDSGWQGSAGLTVLCGGEPMSRSLADALVSRCSTLWNMYGPTETTVWSSVHRVTNGAGPVPIGDPIANTRLYVLDDERRLVADGTVGELWIAGGGVARGYVGRPDLTSERFLADPFAAPGDRMYRTGDLVRRGSDHLLEYLGRVDDQVKLRGHRIELGEVEEALLRHPDVTGAVAAVRHFGDDDERLVAYYTGALARIAPAELRDHVRASLPDYMIPSEFVRLERIPLTPNNKVDRTNLPDPRAPRAPLLGGHAGESHRRSALFETGAPLTTVLRAYREAFADQDIGADDDFFDLGGHSILATRLASRLRGDLGRTVQVRTIFEFPTPAGLAFVLERSAPATNDTALQMRSAELVGDAATGTFELGPSQERMWFVQMLHPRGTAYNLAAALRVRGGVDVDAFRAALVELVARHPALRSSFVTVDGTPRIRVDDRSEVAFELIDISDLDPSARGGRVQTLISDLAEQPFELDKGPLLRVIGIALGDDEFVVGVVMHHIVADQWSFGVMARDLSMLYRARSAGLPWPAHDPASSDPNRYGAWYRAQLASPSVEASIEYWRSTLAELPGELLAPDFARPGIRSEQGTVVRRSIPDDLTDAIRDLARRAHVSEFMVLLAAYQLLIRRVTGATDVPVGVPIANRHWLDSESLITSLVNTVVIRTDLSGVSSFHEVLSRTRHASLDAFEHQDVPFDRLVQELSPRRDLSRSPLFQLFFNVQNAPFEMPQLDGLEFEPVVVERRSAQFDVSLTVDTTITHTFTLEYASELFEHGRMSELLDDYVATLREVVSDPRIGLTLPPGQSHAAAVSIDVLDRAPSPERQTVCPPPHDGLEDTLASIWSRTLGVASVSRHDDFFDLGGHSLLAVRMMAEIHREIGRRPPITALFAAPTIAQFAELLETEGWVTPWTSLIEVQADGTGPPLFYVTPFLISALSIHDLAHELGDDVPLYALQPQGMETDDVIHDSVEAMARHYIAEMRTVQPFGPYRIAGHCAGGWAAFEVARQLRVAGEPVDVLIIVDVEPPGLAPPRPRWFRYALSRIVLYGRSGRMLDALRWQLGLRLENIRNRRTGGEDADRQHAVRSVHRAAHRAYRGGEVDADLVLVRSEEWSRLPDKDWHLRWGELVTGTMTVVEVPGAHASLLAGASVADLGEAIRQSL